MKTFHATSIVGAMKAAKELYTPRKIQLDGKEGYRLRLNSRQARKMRRAGTTLIPV